MSKRSIEFTVLSARGLKRSNPLWKLQTLCVAWIDPEHKYCSKIDKLNDTHPIWNVNFSSIADADADFSEATLTVEVHSREPLFHFSKLECSATVLLKEFVAMADKAGGHCTDTASFQLRSPSGKPRGIVDVCIRVGHKFHSPAASPGDRYSNSSVNADEEEEEEEEPVTAYPATLPSSRQPSGRPEDFPPPNYPYSYPPKITAATQAERPPNSGYRPPPSWPPAAPYSGAAPPPAAPYSGAAYGPQPYGGGPYGYGHYPYPPPQPPLGGDNYFGLPNARPNYGGGPQRPGLGLAAGAMAGGLAGGMLFGLDGLENGINDALSSQFHGGSMSVYGNSLF